MNKDNIPNGREQVNCFIINPLPFFSPVASEFVFCIQLQQLLFWKSGFL